MADKPGTTFVTAKAGTTGPRFLMPGELPMGQHDAYHTKAALHERGFGDVGVYRPSDAVASRGYIVVAFVCGRAVEMRTMDEVAAFVARVEAAL